MRTADDGYVPTWRPRKNLDHSRDDDCSVACSSNL